MRTWYVFCSNCPASASADASDTTCPMSRLSSPPTSTMAMLMLAKICRSFNASLLCVVDGGYAYCVHVAIVPPYEILIALRLPPMLEALQWRQRPHSCLVLCLQMLSRVASKLWAQLVWSAQMSLPCVAQHTARVAPVHVLWVTEVHKKYITQHHLLACLAML